MSSEGLKMGGGRYGLAWNGRKIAKSGDPRWPPLPRLPARFGRVRRRFIVKFHGQGRLVVCSYLGGACNKGVARNTSHGKNPIGLKMGRKDPFRSPRVFGSFPRVLELKMGVLGLGFYLESKTRFI